jgi:hypothetical protein
MSRHVILPGHLLGGSTLQSAGGTRENIVFISSSSSESLSVRRSGMSESESPASETGGGGEGGGKPQ